MKDNFSTQASDYSKFRPNYPDELVEHLISKVSNKAQALDVATGNGQLAQKLVKYFETVHATDISEKQLENAVKSESIIYKLLPAEKTDFSDNKFDLITVAQAIHWFDFDEFYKEVYRILKSDGIFAVLGYGLFTTNQESDDILGDFYHNITGPYWDPERRYLDENYETIPFPFDEIESEKFENNFIWTFEQLIGYLETWSAVQHYKNKNNNENPLDLIRVKLQKTWRNSNKEVTFPLLLRIGKLKTTL